VHPHREASGDQPSRHAEALGINDVRARRCRRRGPHRLGHPLALALTDEDIILGERRDGIRPKVGADDKGCARPFGSCCSAARGSRHHLSLASRLSTRFKHLAAEKSLAARSSVNYCHSEAVRTASGLRNPSVRLTLLKPASNSLTFRVGEPVTYVQVLRN
jgi:hypothetical protein